MDFSLSEERKMLQETVARFFESNYQNINKRNENVNLPEGFCKNFWKESSELGIISALVSPKFGGLGGDGDDISIIFELIGKSLCVEPFLASGVLSSTILSSISNPNLDLINQIVEGKLVIAFAHTEMNNRYEDSFIENSASLKDNKWCLNGSKSFVINGDTANKVIVSARIDGDVNDKAGIGLFLVDNDQIKNRSYNTVDGYRASELIFDTSKAELIARDNEALSCIIKANSAGALALSAEALGIMETCFNLTLDYLKTRNQFGKSIGSFQSIQHRMVDMMLEIEQVKSAVMLASSTYQSDEKSRDKNISAAKNLVGRVGKLVAEETIQLHGGIAMTWEYSASHYAKRLIMIDHLMGDSDYHRDRFKLLSASNL
ncbi:MAG: acyl-CoA dehydrogenase [Alphaproteobacteria bacterium]|nr:acyl-CoA dehydrogenase [Alphaproteobacteria bacterium]